jgi:hypothetical protein
MYIFGFFAPVAVFALVAVVLIFFPLTLWKRTRAFAGSWLVTASYILGLTTWFLAASVTFSSFGWIGLIIGLMIFGVGVVPMSIFGAFFEMEVVELGIALCIMPIVTFIVRMGGVFALRSGTVSRD